MRTTLLATGALWFAAGIVLTAARHETVVSVRDQTAPAVLGALEAHAALSDADRAVWASFRSGEAQLIGPGQDYQDDITIAGQTLAQLAGLQAGGGALGRRLQTINGQLVNYQGLVGQAAATYRSGAAKELGYAYLSYASKSLRDPEGGLLAGIDAVAATDRRSLAAREVAWTSPWLLLAYAVFALPLLASLVYTQRFLRRRFRRTISPPMALASALAIGISLWLCVVSVRSDRAFSGAHEVALPRLNAIWHSQTRTIDGQAKALQAADGASEGGAAARSARAGGLDIAATQVAHDDLDAALAAAADTRALPVALPLAAAAIGGLTVFGLRRRLDEYRA